MVLIIKVSNNYFRDLFLDAVLMKKAICGCGWLI
jgi:hypothetical protein